MRTAFASLPTGDRLMALGLLAFALSVTALGLAAVARNLGSF